MDQKMVTADSGIAGKGATRKLARYAATLSYESLPPALVELMKQCVLDTLGVAIGASTLAEEAGIVADYALRRIVHGEAAASAAFAQAIHDQLGWPLPHLPFMGEKINL